MKRVIVLFLCILLLPCGCSNNENIAFTINGIDVERAELLFYMRRSCDEIMLQIEQDYNLSGEKGDFWVTDIGGITPIEILKKKAEEEIIRIKVMQEKADEYGISSPLSYSKQQSDWKKDNENRLQKEKNGELIYGVTLRSFYTYINQVFLETEKELQQELLDKNVITVNDVEMKAYYTEHSDWFTDDGEDYESVKTSVYSWIFNEKYESYIDSLVANANVEYINMEFDASELE